MLFKKLILRVNQTILKLMPPPILSVLVLEALTWAHTIKAIRNSCSKFL